MGNKTMGQQRPEPYGGQQPRNMMQKPRILDGGEVYMPSYNPPPSGFVSGQGGPNDFQNTNMSRAQMAQQRRNRVFSAGQDPFNQFTAGAQYIGAANGAQLGMPNLGQGTLFDYGNGQYKFGTGPNDLRDIAGNWTFLRS